MVSFSLWATRRPGLAATVRRKPSAGRRVLGCDYRVGFDGPFDRSEVRMQSAFGPESKRSGPLQDVLQASMNRRGHVGRAAAHSAIM